MPQDLRARRGICPAESVVMLAATSNRVRGMLGRLQRRVRAAVRMKRHAWMESVAIGLPRLLAWCTVVSLDLSSVGAGTVSSLATLNPGCNDIGDEGAWSLASVLGQCSSLATLTHSARRGWEPDGGAEGLLVAEHAMSCTQLHRGCMGSEPGEGAGGVLLPHRAGSSEKLHRR